MPATETRKLGSAPRPAVLMTARIAALLGREQCRGLALRRRIELREPRHARGRLRGDSLAVAEHEAPIARCRRTLTFVEHVREIERVGRGERDPFVRLLVATQAPQLLHGLDQRELLAAQRLDEPAAANLAARLRAAIDRQQLTPRRRERLARQQLAADHAVAAQQDLRGLLERLGANGRRGVGRLDQRPTSGRIERGAAAQRAAAAETAAPALRREQRAQAVERVGSHEPARDELAQGFLDLHAQQTTALHELEEEQRAALVQRLQHALGGAGQALARGRDDERAPERRRGARHDRDRRRGHGARAARRRGAARPRPPPDEFTRAAELIEQRRTVVREPRRQHLALPDRGRQREALELAEHGGQRLAALAPLLAEALPMEEESLVVGERGGLDLAAQPLQRVAVDAREQPPLAPFLDGRAARVGGDRRARTGVRTARKIPAHRRALLLERRERRQH